MTNLIKFVFVAAADLILMNKGDIALIRIMIRNELNAVNDKSLSKINQ